jgi:hypothetical protein
VLGVRRRGAVVRDRGQADEHVEPVRERHERLDGQVIRAELPLLQKLACERVGGALPEVNGAARAKRPAAGPARHPVGPPAGEPAAVLGADDAQRRQAVRRVLE